MDSLTITSIAVNQNNGSIYVSTMQNNIFKGVYFCPNLITPWSKISIGLGSLSVNKLDIDSTGTLYIATSSGVYYTTNNTDCYPINYNLPSNFGNYPSISCISSIDSFLYVGTNSGIYRTVKSNINWQLFNQNLPTGNAANRILKYHNYLIASFSNNVYRTNINLSNWVSAISISNGQSTFPPQINYMSANDSGIYLAVEGAWSNTYRSIGDSMIFSPCALTNSLTAYSILAYGNSFFTGTFYGGVYKGTNDGKDLQRINPNLLPGVTVQSLSTYGTALLAGTEYYSYKIGSGGLYYLNNTILGLIDDDFKASQKSQGVLLEWSNDANNPVKQYELERCEETLPNFKRNQTINVYSNINRFSYIDKDINRINKRMYYRLKSIKINGEILYSKIISIISKENISFQISPNPASNLLNVKLPTYFDAANSNLAIFNYNGVRFLEKDNLQSQNFIVDVSKIPKGFYILAISNGDKSVSEKIELK